MSQLNKSRLDEDLHVHPWLKQINICFVPGSEITPLSEEVIENILDQFSRFGHQIQEIPGNDTDVILTTSKFGEPLPWREAISLIGRMRFNYRHSPTIFTLVHVGEEEFNQKIEYFDKALEKDKPDEKDFDFPGLAPSAYKVLYEQGRRGGSILALERLVQAQAKSIRVLLLVGNGQPSKLYHFDLVGANPESYAKGSKPFYEDIVLRMVTSVSTHEITQHKVEDELIPQSKWEKLGTPQAMRIAAQKFGEINFFTEMVIIDTLVKVPAVTDAIASQYSEGCFATWDPEINALITTITGSARPVDKSSLSDDDLAVITGVRADREGALVRHVEGKRNDPPSSEAVELIDIDNALPYIKLPPEWNIESKVPVARSKLHGHRGIASYNPDLVEFVQLDPPYYDYPVTCATDAQATGIKGAFAKSEALQNTNDPRQVVFTVLPTHGIVIAEKWVPEKVPFQTIWEFFQEGHLVLDNMIPQGFHEYQLHGGQMVLKPQ
ncbi:MAG: hypothetical protein ACK2U3_14235 [Anaerolineales bacterium]|jgi:hypothetical protein